MKMQIQITYKKVYVYIFEIKHVVLKESCGFSFDIILSKVGCPLAVMKGHELQIEGNGDFAFLLKFLKFSISLFRLGGCQIALHTALTTSWSGMEAPGTDCFTWPGSSCTDTVLFGSASSQAVGRDYSLDLLLITMLCWMLFSSQVCWHLRLHEAALKHKSFPITILT